jgi:hypothetical protein
MLKFGPWEHEMPRDRISSRQVRLRENLSSLDLRFIHIIIANRRVFTVCTLAIDALAKLMIAKGNITDEEFKARLSANYLAL